MGKPFLSELQQLDATYAAAMSLDMATFQDALAATANVPLIAVGSGGSLSDCALGVLSASKSHGQSGEGMHAMGDHRHAFR